ncbi:MAG TPA: hypothetical protein VNQ31_02220, partial [Sphingomonadaceae bacterium]|nr:hypothetical protein [Sphingomonadaceae bacterium]
MLAALLRPTSQSACYNHFMRAKTIRSLAQAVIAAAFLVPVAGSAPAQPLPAVVANARAQTASPQAIAEYRRKLQIYLAAREAFNAEASTYWDTIAEKRRMRFAKRRSGQPLTLDDYVLTQPPVYDGPKRPVNPEPEETEPRERKPLPVVADFLQAARAYYQFV